MTATEVCPHCGASVSLDENHADAVLLDDEIGRQIARSFRLYPPSSRWKNAGEYDDWLARKLELNRVERFMARPWFKVAP